MKKELLAKNKNILKALHELRGFDFNSDFTIQKHSGKFTLNSIKKSLSDIDLDNNNTVVIIAGAKYMGDRLYIVNVFSDGFGISFSKRVYHYGIDDFWSKSRFEEIRKDESKTFYIVTQEKKLEKTASNKKPDLSQRFEFVRFIGWGDGKGKNGISQIDIKDLQHNGKQFAVKTSRPESSTNVNYFIDKSGYLCEEKKQNLKQQAKELKSKREKAAVNDFDFSKDISNIRNLTVELKNKCDLLLKNAVTYDAICNFESVLRSYRWLLLSVERFEKSNTEKRFSSIEEAQKKIANIYEEIEKTKNLF